MKNKTKNQWLTFLLFGIIATVCFFKLFAGSVSLNGNVMHCMTADYWNFGKCMIGGHQLYIDLIDHKGVYIYWIYGLLHILSGGNIGIVAVVESLLFAGTIAFFYKMVKTITNSKRKSALLSTLYAVVYFFITFNATLINVEGLFVPFYFWIYYVAIYKEKPTKKDFFWIGVLLGFFCTIKYSSVLYFAYFFVYCTIFYFLRHHDFKNYAKLIMNGLAGLILSILPFFVYFIKTRTLSVYLELMKISSSFDYKWLILCFVTSVIFLIVAIVMYRKGNQKFEIMVCYSILMLSFVGAFFISNYFCLLFSILIPPAYLYFQKEDRSVPYAFSLLAMFILCIYITYGLYEDNGEISSNTPESNTISSTYDINNSNILYFTEDLGYGANKPELFQEKYQWLSARMLSNELFYEEIKNIYTEYIVSCRFEYIVGYESVISNEEDKDTYQTFWESLYPLVEKNYTEIKDTHLIDGTTLWKAKEHP